MVADNFEIKDNTASLFRVDDKKSDKHPDYTGKGKYKGEMVYLSAWLKEAKSGKKYLSIAINEPREQSNAPAGKPSGGKSFADMKEDLPF